MNVFHIHVRENEVTKTTPQVESPVSFFFFLRSKVELCHFGADEWKRRILALSASYRSVQGSCSQKRQKTA